MTDAPDSLQSVQLEEAPMACTSSVPIVLTTLFATSVTLIGCYSGPGIEQLKVKAAADLTCNQLTLNQLANCMYAADGCGRKDVYLSPYCMGQWISPLDRAAFELSCPREQLSAQFISDLSVGVSGCDKKAVYIIGAQGNWIMNSVSDKDQSKSH
ncbi:MAG: hypothetical protein IT373_02610 [Polyangiaceae bacterium]|nr:hypothetical protein [Polyangiaceae bacterium]